MLHPCILLADGERDSATALELTVPCFSVPTVVNEVRGVARVLKRVQPEPPWARSADLTGLTRTSRASAVNHLFQAIKRSVVSFTCGQHLTFGGCRNPCIKVRYLQLEFQ